MKDQINWQSIMPTLKKEIFMFCELPENVQSKVLDRFYNINVDYEWWDCIYEQAKEVGIKITEFDIDRGNKIKGDFVNGQAEYTANAIIENYHNGGLLKSANKYIQERAELVKKYSDGVDIETVKEENEWDFDAECEELDESFKRDILEDFLYILRSEYDYQTSEEQVKESIIANEYQFTEDGEMI